MASPRVSLRGLIAAGPQPSDSGMFRYASDDPGRAIVVVSAQAREGLHDKLATIRQRARERQSARDPQRSAGDAPAHLSGQDANFLRDIGAL